MLAVEDVFHGRIGLCLDYGTRNKLISYQKKDVCDSHDKQTIVGRLLVVL